MGMSTPVPVPVRASASAVPVPILQQIRDAIVGCGNCGNAGMDRDGSASPPRSLSLFSIVQSPPSSSRARRARDSRLERGGGAADGGGRSRPSRDCNFARVLANIRSVQESRFQGPAGSSAGYLWLIQPPLPPRLLVALPWLGSRHLGRNRQAENQRSSSHKSEYVRLPIVELLYAEDRLS